MKRRFHRHVLYGLLVWARALFLLVPYRWTFAFGGWMGRVTFRLLPKERRRTLEHLSLAFGREKTPGEIRALGSKVFEHYGRTLAEMAMVDKLIGPFDRYVTATGYEHLDRVLAQGRGMIVTVGHFGNWEFMAGYMAIKGYPARVIARKIYFEPYDRLLVDLRRKMKVETIYRDSSPRSMLSVLRKNGILAFAVDQAVDTVEGVFSAFFGRPAYTPVAPVRFSLVSGAPIVPAFIVREGIRHRVIVEPPIELEVSGDRERDIRVNTQKWVDIQERYIRKYPHLWVWNHRRWKLTPEMTSRLSAESVVNQ